MVGCESYKTEAFRCFFFSAQWVMAVYFRRGNLCWPSWSHNGQSRNTCFYITANVFTDIGWNPLMHRYSSVKPCEESMQSQIILSFVSFDVSVLVPLCSLKAWQTFCGGVMLHSVLAPVCINSIFSSRHLKGRRCQVVQQSQRFTARCSRSFCGKAALCMTEGGNGREV